MTDFVVADEKTETHADPLAELASEIRELRFCLAQVYEAIARSYNLQVAQMQRPRVFVPHPRQTLAPGANVRFDVSAHETDWVISVEQSTNPLALAIYQSNGRTVTPVEQLAASDSIRFPATSDILVVENVGTFAINFSIVETNYE